MRRLEGPLLERVQLTRGSRRPPAPGTWSAATRRLLTVLAAAAVAFPGLLAFTAEPAAADLSKKWTSDADFAGGTFTNTKIAGTGDAASIQLAISPTYDWSLVEPVVAPSPRRGVAMTFDEENGVILAFGGRTLVPSYVNELWEYDTLANTWTNITPDSGPPGRWKAGLSYDPALKAAIMYGGEDFYDWRTDLWRYYVTNRTWQELRPGGRVPRSLMNPPLVYDIAAQRHILAGMNGFTSLLETWAYDALANQWTPLDPPEPFAPPVVGHTLTYDRISQHVVLFGGAGGGMNADVWEYDYASNTWVLATPWKENETPNGRMDHGMVFGPEGAMSILFGGFDDTSYQPGTWTYASASRLWLRPIVGIYPLARKQHGMAWDSANDRTVMFGGMLSDDTVTNETWVWGPALAARGTYASATFDAGCESPIWHTLWWNATVPPKTTARFKLATSDSPAGPFTFRGWNGLPGTYYNGTPGQAIWLGHNQPPIQRYLQWSATLTTATGKDTPAVDDVTVSFECFALLPYIVSTNPAHLASGVRLSASIVATFNVPMDPSTVTWTFSDPAVTFTPSWNSDHTILGLSHTVPFKKCRFQTIQIFGKDQAHGYDLVVGPVPNPWTFSMECWAPKILETTPADGDLDVALGADLVVVFSDPMDASSVQWTITGGIPLTPSWDGTGAILTLSHAAPFTACTVYTAEITEAKDTVGIDIIPGPVPNPWSFVTACPNPYIVRTDPVHGSMFVPVGAPIVVTFSKPMDTASVTVVIDPPIPLARSWNSPTDTVLTLTHAAPFTGATRYTVNVVAGREKGGLPLVPGPVPNPWSFWTVAVEPLRGPAHLRVSMAGADVRLDWDPVLGAARYDVYGSQDRLGVWPWDALGTTTTPTFLANGHGADGQTHYYIVRASDGFQEGPNSTMGVKTTLELGRSMVNTNIAWFSLPYDSTYRRASDIAGELGPERIDVVGKWVPARQTSIVYYYARGGWRGTDFPIGAGDGLYLGARRAFSWNITGTDANATLSFTLNPPPRANINWIGLPYTGVYSRASDVSTALGPSKVVEIGLWNEVAQSVVWWYWTGSAWTGADFTIVPGAGVYLLIVSSFAWTPALIIPTVP